METDWNNLFKIRIANPNDSFQKHEIIKLLICMKILNNYSNRSWLRIYTEFNLNNGSGLKPDIYVEDIKAKTILCYEIQKNLSKKWLKEKTKQYNEYEIPYFTLDLIIVPIKKLSDNLEELNKQLDEYIL